MQLIHPRLLITDDDRGFRETLGEALQRRGFETLLAEDGQHAIEIVQSQPVHLMLLDMHMPRLTGLQTIALVRQIPNSSSGGPLPCILMSAKLDDSIVFQANELETVAVFEKPFSLHSVTTTIQNALRSVYGWSG